MRLGRGGGVKGSIIGGGGSNIIFPINKMCGVILENKRATVFFFVCLLVFFLQRELLLVFGALQPSNFISQNTVINDQMTSIDQKIVYETLYTSIFLKLLLCVERARSEQARQ